MEDQGSSGSTVMSEAEKCQARYLHVAVTNTGTGNLNLAVKVSMADVTVYVAGASFWMLSALTTMLALAVATLV